MGQQIELTAADGHRLGTYVATPAGKARGALVVVQEIFGVNSHIRSVADSYAADGYMSVAPALFDRIERSIEIGYADADMARGRTLKAQGSNDKALADIAAAIAHAQGAGKVGIVGFCWGGLLAWLAAGQLDGLAASVAYYGGGVPDHRQLGPRCPVLAHFGKEDHLIPLSSVEGFKAAQPDVTVHLYDAGHGFNCNERGSYDAACARLARERTLAFLRRHVG